MFVDSLTLPVVKMCVLLTNLIQLYVEKQKNGIKINCKIYCVNVVRDLMNEHFVST